MQIGLEQIYNINSFKENINPKILICSLCYCINIDVEQCKNKKCGKLFCGNCVNKIIISKKNSNVLCPFCRVEFEYIKVDEKIFETINNLKFFCNYKITCNKSYSYYELKEKHEHIKNKDDIFCFICKEKNNHNIKKCLNCMNFICEFKCSGKCIDCNLSICFICLSNNFYQKIIKSNLLCGLCTQTKNCYKCNKESEIVCSLCNEYLCKNCGEFCNECCLYFCKENSCFKSKIKNYCSNCLNEIKKKKKKCIHLTLLNCFICYPKCKICKTIPHYNNKCKNCKENICSFCTTKCKKCHNNFCKNCILKCSICKKNFCIKCIKFCSNCGKENSYIYSCENCNSDTLRKCNEIKCNKLLCLNCWNVCNTCDKIYCNEHTNLCVNCEESMCNEHYYICKKCNKENKLCLKKCTLKCDFCNNISTLICKVENHKNNYVNNYNCIHNICEKEIKKCFKCKEIVISCPKCIVNYYFSNCVYCHQYLCTKCCEYCKKCEDFICNLTHICEFCGKIVKYQYCLKCFDNKKNICFICKAKLQANKNNIKIFVCSIKCYLNYMIKNSSNNEINFEMFICNKHIFEYQIKKKTKNLLNKAEKYDKEINKELKESKNLNSKKFEKEKDCIIF